MRDDVLFSLNRAKDPDSVPDHRTYSLHEHIKDVEVVTDLATLEGIKESSGTSSVREALEKDLDSKITELVADKNRSE